MITMIYLLLQSPQKIFQSPYSHSFTAFLERTAFRKLDYFLKLYHQRKFQNAAMYGPQKIPAMLQNWYCEW
jgi:hypothetical protein